ncbi:hypothetical protein GCM10028791_18310 [Echinicola sediminis]
MKKEKMKIGDRHHIQFELVLTKDKPTNKLSKINFYLGKKLISNEAVYVPTYILRFQNLLNKLNSEQFKDIKFDKLSHEQAYGLLMKERECEEPRFFRHLFQLDETIDQYTIFIFQTDLLIRFVWSCWDRDNCNADHELDVVNAVQFPIEKVILTVKKLIVELKQNMI